MKPLLFVDVETSALTPGRHGDYFGELLEIAIIVDFGNGATPIENIWRFKPMYEQQHDPKAMQINQYNERIKSYVGLRPYYDAMYEIHKTLSKRGIIVVGHNLPFDLKHLNFWFRKCGYKPVNPRTIDTMHLAFEHLTPCGLSSLSLDKIKSFMRYKMPGHDALNDARACRQLYYETIRAGKVRRLYWMLRNLYTQAENMLFK